MRTLLVLILLISFHSTSLSGQREWEPSCPDCEITLELVLTLGDEEGEGYVNPANTVRRGEHFYYVRNHLEPEVVKIFDLSGQFVGTVGGPGEGPGEFRGGSAIEVSVGDSLFVIDPRLRRISVFSPDLEFVRSVQFPSLRLEDYPPVLLPGGRLLLNGSISTKDLVGLPHHVFDENGNRMVSFGDPLGRFSPAPNDFLRYVALSTPESVWVTHAWEYRITRWTLEGKRMGEIRPIRPWFEEYKYDGTPSTERDGTPIPRPGILAVCQRPDGLLWVIGRGHHPDWRAAVGPDGKIVNVEGYVAPMIELLDPDEGRLVASLRVTGGLVGGFLDSDHVYGTVYEGPFPKAAIWRVRLQHPERPVE